MVKKTVKNVDFDGNEGTEDFYFHLTEQELSEWELSVDGGLSTVLRKIIKSKDEKALIEIYKDLLTRSYGVKTQDGRSFVKNQEALDNFIYTQAFSDIYMELATNDKAASEFVNGVIPASVMAKAKEEEEAKDH
jgi:hypothetical protein